MKLTRLFGVLTVVAALFTITLVLLLAQQAPPVLTLPINRANFLRGAKFKFRVEAHAAEMLKISA